MKISLSVSEENYKDIENKLLALGFVIEDDAPFVLTERNRYAEFICGKDEDVSCHIPVGQVVYIESMGHDIFVHTEGKTYSLGLYKSDENMKSDIENGGIPSADTFIDIEITME